MTRLVVTRLVVTRLVVTRLVVTRLAARLAVALVLLSAAVVVVSPGGPADAQPSCQPARDAATTVEPWPQQQLAYDQAWSTARGQGVTVAVLDTGVSAAAPALAGRVLPGIDVATGGRADNDCLGHGTFVAALIGARPVTGSAFVGVAPDARILPVRVVARDGELDVAPETLALGIDAAVSRGAAVIATAATAPYSSAALVAAVRRAHHRGVLILAPAWTTRRQDGDVAEPAALPGVVAVQGVDSFGRAVEEGTPEAHPTVCAPAADLTGVPPSGHGTIAGSGSALAVGIAAGVAALIRGRYPGTTPDQLEARLVATAVPLAATPVTALAGAGLVDPVAAVGDVAAQPGEHGPAVARPARVVPNSPVARPDRPAQAAVRWTAAVFGGAVLVGLLVVTARAGRTRSRQRAQRSAVST